jgi:hypothetical protein
MLDRMASRIRRVFNADRIPTTRLALRVATCATVAGMASFGSCGLLVGGIHGLVIASVLTGVIGGVLGAFALTLGVVTDGTRAMGEALNLWEPVITTEVETDAGQLSVLREDADGEVSLVVDPRPRSP